MAEVYYYSLTVFIFVLAAASPASLSSAGDFLAEADNEDYFSSKFDEGEMPDGVENAVLDYDYDYGGPDGEPTDVVYDDDGNSGSKQQNSPPVGPIKSAKPPLFWSSRLFFPSPPDGEEHDGGHYDYETGQPDDVDSPLPHHNVEKAEDIYQDYNQQHNENPPAPPAPSPPVYDEVEPIYDDLSFGDVMFQEDASFSDNNGLASARLDDGNIEGDNDDDDDDGSDVSTGAVLTDDPAAIFSSTSHWPSARLRHKKHPTFKVAGANSTCCVPSNACSGCFTMGLHEICNECIGGTTCGTCTSFDRYCAVSCICSCARSSSGTCNPCQYGSRGCSVHNAVSCNPHQACGCTPIKGGCSPSCLDLTNGKSRRQLRDYK